MFSAAFEYGFPNESLLPNGNILISTALSGGTLTWRLEQAIRHYGRNKVIPALERTAMDFPLPAPNGMGIPLSPAQLQKKITYFSPTVHFSPALCAQYFLYRDIEGLPRFVLFDNPGSFRRKLKLIRSLGLTCAVASFPQVHDWLEEMKGWEELSSQPK